MDLLSKSIPLVACPFCNAPYADAKKERLTAQGDKEELVHVTCNGCVRSLVLSIVRTATKLRSVGMITDCSAEDYVKFRRTSKISMNDVIAVYEQLRTTSC